MAFTPGRSRHPDAHPHTPATHLHTPAYASFSVDAGLTLPPPKNDGSAAQNGKPAQPQYVTLEFDAAHIDRYNADNVITLDAGLDSITLAAGLYRGHLNLALEENDSTPDRFGITLRMHDVTNAGNPVLLKQLLPVGYQRANGQQNISQVYFHVPFVLPVSLGAPVAFEVGVRQAISGRANDIDTVAGGELALIREGGLS